MTAQLCWPRARSQRDSSPLCMSSPSIPPSVPQPFLLPVCHGILVLSQLAALAALAAPGRPPLAAGRTVWKGLSLLIPSPGDVSSSLNTAIIAFPAASPLPSLLPQAPSWWDSQNKHPPICSRAPAWEMTEAIITHSAQQNYPARGRRGRKQLEIIHGERCSHPRCLPARLIPNQPGAAIYTVDVTAMARLFGYVDVTDSGFIAAVLSIAFNPLFWNVVARWEHKTRALSRVFGSPRAACYCLGAVILMLNCVRSHCFTEAMKSQPKLEGLDCHWAYYLGLAVLAVGTLFVISSFLALGFTGTFLGDYFGILMEAKVTSFPFSILDNPMYWGSTAVYLGWSLMHASPAGLLLTAVVAISYTIAMLYEGPFTEEIYRQKQKGVKNK
ncbi:phosphatidylethanolamine N-methyltransferase isoform 1-T2 [Morphnus guianensis]